MRHTHTLPEKMRPQGTTGRTDMAVAAAIELRRAEIEQGLFVYSPIWRPSCTSRWAWRARRVFPEEAGRRPARSTTKAGREGGREGESGVRFIAIEILIDGRDPVVNRVK